MNFVSFDYVIIQDKKIKFSSRFRKPRRGGTTIAPGGVKQNPGLRVFLNFLAEEREWFEAQNRIEAMLRYA
ncbi:hypothetical protein CWD77_00760 [Rhodohalobacter barkolensis]|uniref:Uncharacterized protein n=1 Tax=Rhodohalobacter barkolensis TaxID=2053187 RepID=A0A2N0VIM7_9BACT|nr:hypothetical protein CWD77_00760 [Rhodohalobacter barkolensis]